MQLTKNEFQILNIIRDDTAKSLRDIVDYSHLSLGTVHKVYHDLRDKGLLEEFSITERGVLALKPYKVDNAIIMAAGLSSRFVPLSYEKPKGLYSVKGEVLIERQIRQLQEAGISDITVVVGYMKESFFYLEEAFNVKIVVNEEYVKRNNNSTLMLVKDQLRNTYICTSDSYFSVNVFELYVYKAFYSALYFEGETDEYCLKVGAGDRITGITVGGADSYAMFGHVYFDRNFSETFSKILTEVYDRPETAPKLWEDIFCDHVKELDMVMRPYDAGVMYEFDSLNDLKAFDQDFIENVDSHILDNICHVLGCVRHDIDNVAPIKAGLTNLSFRFTCAGEQYVYRYPGPGTESIINRHSEAFSQGVAKRLGIDDTFIFEDPEKGWKISRYIPDCTPFDYHNPTHVSKALDLARRLHRSGEKSEWGFDVFEKACEIKALLADRAYPSFPDFEAMAQTAEKLAQLVRQDGIESCLCHNDFYDPNFLIKDDLIYLIDWEYSAMSDYASDLGTFVCCSDYTIQEAHGVIKEYFRGKPTEAEIRHCMAYVGISAYYWFVWALFKEAEGDSVGEWLYLWYKAAKTYGTYALELYA